MRYKSCSINRVIAKVFRDFKPSHSGWITDAIEWIGEAIDIMKCGGAYGEQVKRVKVIDFRAKMPCELESLLGISHEGRRLPRNGGFKTKDLKDSKISLLPNCILKSYTLSNPNYINLSFRKGHIEVYYLGIDKDCDGFPEIIDDALVLQALEWYVMMMMLGRGFKHQVFTYKDAEERWIKAYPRAQNRIRILDIDGYQHFKKIWTGMLAGVNDPVSKFFNSVDYELITPHAHNPGDLLKNFNLMGVNTRLLEEDEDNKIDPKEDNI